MVSFLLFLLDCAAVFTQRVKRQVDTVRVRQAVAETQAVDRTLLATRASLLGSIQMKGLASHPAPLLRRVFDCENSSDIARRQVLEEGGSIPNDIAVKKAYVGAGETWEFYHDLFGRSSIDNAGLTLVSSVHYLIHYSNAVWNGHQMVYGNGDGVIFDRFTKSIDIIGHELTHGVTQFTAGLTYSWQSGALNEHFSDVFGILIKQRSLGERDPARASWIIGEGILKPNIRGVGLRSMSRRELLMTILNSGLGKDPQPSHMRDYVHLADTEETDHGGVHYNSGIPNHAFYLAAVAIGEPAWEVAGRIWYVTFDPALAPRRRLYQMRLGNDLRCTRSRGRCGRRRGARCARRSTRRGCPRRRCRSAGRCRPAR